MIQTVKPLMLETSKGDFINANRIYTIEDDKRVYYEAAPNKCETCMLTDEAYDLLTDTTKQSQQLDVCV